MTKTARRPSKRKGGGEEVGGVGATPKEMARAKHMITNNKEERKKQRARYIFTPQNVHEEIFSLKDGGEAQVQCDTRCWRR